MTELEKKIEQLEEILIEEGEPDALSGCTRPDQIAILQRISRQIGKRQNRYSNRSEEYARLKAQREQVEEVALLLEQIEKEQSGLRTISDEKATTYEEAVCQKEETVSKKEDETQKDTLYTNEYVEELCVKYKQAYKESDIAEMQRIHKQVYKHMQNEPGQAANTLAVFAYYEKRSKGATAGLLYTGMECGFPTSASNLSWQLLKGKRMPKDLSMAQKYLEKAAEGGNKKAIYRLAKELFIRGDFDFEKDYKRAYALFRQYLEMSMPLDNADDDHRYAVFSCYRLGTLLGLDMDKEEIPVSLRWLIENEGNYTDRARKLEGDIRRAQERYDDAVDVYLRIQTVDSIQAVMELLFEDYYMKQPEKRYKLDSALKRMRDDIGAKPEVRALLYKWYAKRHEEGNYVEKSMPLAYLQYLKAQRLGYDKKVEESLLSLDSRYQGDIAFYEDVLDEGGMEVAYKVGDYYMQKCLYDKALENYQQGIDLFYHVKDKKVCQERFDKCKAIVKRQRDERRQSQPLYEQCLENGLSLKTSLFSELRSQANGGNAYAAFCVAQLAETDPYLRQHANNFPSNEEIIRLYSSAAKAGERDARIRLVDIYTSGLLGTKKDDYQANYWRKMI